MPLKTSCLPLLDRFHCCCCSCSLKNATIALGWIQAVANCFQLAWFSVYLVKFEDVSQLFWFGKEVRVVCFGHQLLFDSRTLAIAVVSEAAIFEFCCLLLLYGAHRKKSEYMIPYLIISQLWIVLLVLIIAVIGFSELFRMFIIGLGLIMGGYALIVVMFYLWLVKYSFYRKLVEMNNRQRAQEENVSSVKPAVEQIGLT